MLKAYTHASLEPDSIFKSYQRHYVNGKKLGTGQKVVRLLRWYGTEVIVLYQKGCVKFTLIKAAGNDCMFTIRNITVENLLFKGVVNCQNSRDKGPPEGNSARG